MNDPHDPSAEQANTKQANTGQAVADDRLLARFVQTKDEAAFRGLVERHSSLVMGVCRRVLHHQHDAEEAFQATFMVLAQKADRIEIANTLAPWLYGVAYRVAIRAAQKKTRRREHSLPADIMENSTHQNNAEPNIDVLASLADSHWRQVLDDELHRLPRKYREPLVLHYLLGKNNTQIAAELGLSVRTVEGRQRRGKEKLRRRLALRKVSLPLAVATLAAASGTVEAAVPAVLIDTTVAASLSWAAGQEVAASSQGALSLARPEVVAMNSPLIPTSVAAIVLLAAGATFGLAGDDAVPAGSAGGAVSLTELVDDTQLESEPLNDIAVQLAVATSEATKSDREGVESAKPQAEKQSSGAVAAFEYLPRTLSSNERQIYAALATPLKLPLDCNEIPLNQFVQAISEDYDVQIIFDRPALEALAISEETEVSINVRDIPLRSTLKLILDQVEDLTYLVKDDVLWITSKDEAEAYLETRIYDLSSMNVDMKELLAVLQKTVEGGSWMSNGTGDGEALSIGTHLLVISQTQAVHEKIAEFMAELQEIEATGK